MTKTRSFSGVEARLMLRRARTGTLASIDREGGAPYASLVNVANDVGGEPIILVSELAWHTRNLLADPRASLLVAETPADGDALTGPRVTVIGRFVKDADPRLRRRYLARHPEAQIYADFNDFSFWRLEPGLAHAVAGFGRIETLTASEIFEPFPEMAAIEESAIEHMNTDHADAVQRLAGGLGGKGEGWTMSAIDPDGALLTNGRQVLRLAFDEPVREAGVLRTTLAALSRPS